MSERHAFWSEFCADILGGESYSKPPHEPEGLLWGAQGSSESQHGLVQCVRVQPESIVVLFAEWKEADRQRGVQSEVPKYETILSIWTIFCMSWYGNTRCAAQWWD